MQNPNPNPSKNSSPTTNKSPQDPPSDDESPKETNPTTLQSSLSMEEEDVLKTALEVLVEFRARENGKLASDGQAMKRRKSNIREVEDVYPHCHRCKHVFPTWGAVMKHLQEHHFCCDPNGFSAPPSFSALPSTSTAIPSQPDQYQGDDESQAMEIEDPSESDDAASESGDAASESDDAAPESDEGKGLGLDLNELPPNEEK